MPLCEITPQNMRQPSCRGLLRYTVVNGCRWDEDEDGHGDGDGYWDGFGSSDGVNLSIAKTSL